MPKRAYARLIPPAWNAEIGVAGEMTKSKRASSLSIEAPNAARCTSEPARRAPGILAPSRATSTNPGSHSRIISSGIAARRLAAQRTNEFYEFTRRPLQAIRWARRVRRETRVELPRSRRRPAPEDRRIRSAAGFIGRSALPGACGPRARSAAMLRRPGSSRRGLVRTSPPAWRRRRGRCVRWVRCGRRWRRRSEDWPERARTSASNPRRRTMRPECVSNLPRQCRYARRRRRSRHRRRRRPMSRRASYRGSRDCASGVMRRDEADAANARASVRGVRPKRSCTKACNPQQALRCNLMMTRPTGTRT